jgi:PAS domain S-box-containing protein
MGMRVGELARRTGVGVSTLRAWERRFQFLQPERSPAGHRLYEEVDVDRVDAVLRLVAEGLTLAAAIARVGSGMQQAGEAESMLYGQILEAAEQGVWVAKDGRTRYANRRMAEIMGYSLEELATIPVLEFFDPEVLPFIREQTMRVRAGQRLQFTTELRRSDGTMILVELNSTPILNQAGGYEGAVALVTDITERTKADAEARLRATQAETLALLGAQVLRHPPGPGVAEPLILTEAVEATRRLLEADQATVLDLVASAHELRVRAASPEMDAGAAVPAGSRSFAGYTALARKVIMVDNAHDDRRFDPLPAQLGGRTASAIGAPIFGPDGLLGVLVAESSTPNHFGQGDAHFVQGMANIIGTALLKRAVDAG